MLACIVSAGAAVIFCPCVVAYTFVFPGAVVRFRQSSDMDVQRRLLDMLDAEVVAASPLTVHSDTSSDSDDHHGEHARVAPAASPAATAAAVPHTPLASGPPAVSSSEGSDFQSPVRRTDIHPTHASASGAAASGAAAAAVAAAAAGGQDGRQDRRQVAERIPPPPPPPLPRQRRRRRRRTGGDARKRVRSAENADHHDGHFDDEDDEEEDDDDEDNDRHGDDDDDDNDDDGGDDADDVVEGVEERSGGGEGKPANRAVKADKEEEEEEGDACPICFEAWGVSGPHRLAALRCGHLFGQSCIKRWLGGRGGKCPQCNQSAKAKDVLPLYARKLVAVDTTERDRLAAELERERERRVKVEASESKLVRERDALRAALASLQASLEDMRKRQRSGEFEVVGSASPGSEGVCDGVCVMVCVCDGVCVMVCV
jgi:hypothetical protein